MASKNVDEYLVCVPKYDVKKYNVMRFNAGDKVDIRNWISGTLSRDMSAKKIYEQEEVYPEYGEGSEYGRKQREEARRLKYGIRKSRFKESDQPWDLSVTTIDNNANIKKKTNGKSDIKPSLITKEYFGKKEGGIGEGSMYFIFTQRPDFTFEAHPVEDWFNFRRKIQHRTLTDEEAEAAWDKRDKIVNHLNFMARKRLHIDDETEEGAEDGSSKTKSQSVKKEKSSDLMIHDNEDYELYMSGGSSDEESSDGEKSSKKKKKTKKTSKPTDEDDDKPDADEDSDDGEHEGTEIAYASDVSSENEEVNESKVVPRGLDELSSSSSSEDEEDANKEKLDSSNVASKEDKAKDSDGSSASGDSDSDIDNDDSISKSALFMKKIKISPKDKKKDNRPGSRSSTPNAELAGSRKAESSKKLDDKGRNSPFGTSKSSLLGKRHAADATDDVSSKQSKLANFRTNTPTKDILQQGITEEAVRKYLTLKPITTKDLLKKFKTKKTGLSSEKIVEKVANILKKLNPQQSKINGKMHLFLKST